MRHKCSLASRIESDQSPIQLKSHRPYQLPGFCLPEPVNPWWAKDNILVDTANLGLVSDFHWTGSWHSSYWSGSKPMLTGKISYNRLLHPPILFPVPFWVQNCFCLHPSSTPSSVGRFAPSRPFLQYKLHSKLQQQDFKQPQLLQGLTYWAETNTVELVFPYSFTGYP